MIIKKTIKNIAHAFGVDILKRQNSPRLTLLGLKGCPFRTIIDVGANTGQFAKEISRFFPTATLYCFEPVPSSFQELKNWALAERGRVVPYNLAIGDSECDLEMFVHEDHTTSSSLLPSTNIAKSLFPFIEKQKLVLVRQTTLDAIIASTKIELQPEILIKVDVQGYEDKVILGGKQAFRAASACILEISLDNLYEKQARFIDLLIMLGELGYQYKGNLDQVYGQDGHVIFFDALFRKR